MGINIWLDWKSFHNRMLNDKSQSISYCPAPRVVPHLLPCSRSCAPDLSNATRITTVVWSRSKKTDSCAFNNSHFRKKLTEPAFQFHFQYSHVKISYTLEAICFFLSDFTILWFDRRLVMVGRYSFTCMRPGSHRGPLLSQILDFAWVWVSNQ